MAGRPPIANPETDPGSSLRGRGVDVLTMWWKWMAGIGAAVLTVVVAGVVVLAPGDGSRPMAGTLTTTTSASARVAPPTGRRTRGTPATWVAGSTKATPASGTATDPHPGWYCANGGAPSPHYATGAASSEHSCTDSELAADPPDWAKANSASAVSQSYWSCWDSGPPQPHHLGHSTPHEHLCTNGELADVGS
jgi:hypothetical protein